MGLKPSRSIRPSANGSPVSVRDSDPVGEQALKAAPVGQPGQIVGQRYGHRRLPRLLGDALLFGDHEP